MENSINIFLVENYFLKIRQWKDGERMTLKNGDTLQNGKQTIGLIARQVQ